MPMKLVILGEARIGHPGVPASFSIDCFLYCFMPRRSGCVLSLPVCDNVNLRPTAYCSGWCTTNHQPQPAQKRQFENCLTQIPPRLQPRHGLLAKFATRILTCTVIFRSYTLPNLHQHRCRTAALSHLAGVSRTLQGLCPRTSRLLRKAYCGPFLVCNISTSSEDCCPELCASFRCSRGTLIVKTGPLMAFGRHFQKPERSACFMAGPKAHEPGKMQI